jgi:hypothetical protein
MVTKSWLFFFWHLVHIQVGRRYKKEEIMLLSKGTGSFSWPGKELRGRKSESLAKFYWGNRK